MVTTEPSEASPAGASASAVARALATASLRQCPLHTLVLVGELELDAVREVRTGAHRVVDDRADGRQVADGDAHTCFCAEYDTMAVPPLS